MSHWAASDHSAWPSTWSGRSGHCCHRRDLWAFSCTFGRCHWSQVQCHSHMRRVGCRLDCHCGNHTYCSVQSNVRGWGCVGGHRVGQESVPWEGERATIRILREEVELKRRGRVFSSASWSVTGTGQNYSIPLIPLLTHTGFPTSVTP